MKILQLRFNEKLFISVILKSNQNLFQEKIYYINQNFLLYQQRPGRKIWHGMTFWESYIKRNCICDALRDLVAFEQFKKREKHPQRSVTDL